MSNVSEWSKKLDGYFIAFCRRAFGWSHFKREALKKAKQHTGKYRCFLCGIEALKVHVDHVNPVVPTSGPWDRDWNRYRNRLFTDQVRVLCVPCHKVKTGMEQKERKKNRESNKDGI